MTAPPGLAPTTVPRVEQISAESDTGLSTRTQQMRFLVAELGISRCQAHRLLVAWEADLAQEAAERRRIEYAAMAANETRAAATFPTTLQQWLRAMSYDTGRDHHAPGWARKIRSPRGAEPR